MHINNEIGTMQPVEEIGEICAKKQERSKRLNISIKRYIPVCVYVKSLSLKA